MDAQAHTGLTGDPGDDRMILMCSFGDFPHDKFVKSLLVPGSWFRDLRNNIERGKHESNRVQKQKAEVAI